MLAWILRNVGNFDVIHLQYVWAATTLIGSLGGRLRSVPVVLTPHESLTSFDIDITSGSQLKRRLKLLLRSVILTNVDVIAFSSELERSDSSTLGRPNVVVYHAVCESPRPTALPEPSGPDLVMGFLGRLHPKKNLEVLIDSISLLGSGRSRLIVAGGGPKAYESELKQRAVKLGVEDRIEWRGQISHDEREGFFGELHLLLMPSEYECFGMVAAEAMATGVPPVVSGNSGIANLISKFDAGSVLENVSDESLAREIEAPASRSDRTSIRQNAILAVKQELTFGAYARQTAQLYESISHQGLA
jgi:glycosyltransferase involved in cell wall biosynthesis